MRFDNSSRSHTLVNFTLLSSARTTIVITIYRLSFDLGDSAEVLRDDIQAILVHMQRLTFLVWPDRRTHVAFLYLVDDHDISGSAVFLDLQVSKVSSAGSTKSSCTVDSRMHTHGNSRHSQHYRSVFVKIPRRRYINQKL